MENNHNHLRPHLPQQCPQQQLPLYPQQRQQQQQLPLHPEQRPEQQQLPVHQQPQQLPFHHNVNQYCHPQQWQQPQRQQRHDDVHKYDHPQYFPKQQLHHSQLQQPPVPLQPRQQQQQLHHSQLQQQPVPLLPRQQQQLLHHAQLQQQPVLLQPSQQQQQVLHNVYQVGHPQQLPQQQLQHHHHHQACLHQWPSVQQNNRPPQPLPHQLQLLQGVLPLESSDNSLKNYPPGYRFIPTDQELINEYLTKILAKHSLPSNGIHEVYIYDYTPEELTDKFPWTRLNALNHWYFISPRENKYRHGSRPSRTLTTGAGYWKPTGNDSKVFYEGKVIGFKKSLEFFKGKSPLGQKTDWKMHEYRVKEKDPAPIKGHEDQYKMDPVLCRIYLNRKIKQQYENGVSGQHIMNEDHGQVVLANEGLLRVENNDLAASNILETENVVFVASNVWNEDHGQGIVANEGFLKPENNDLVAGKISSRNSRNNPSPGNVNTTTNTSPNPGGDSSSGQVVVSDIPNFTVPPADFTYKPSIGDMTTINTSSNSGSDGRSGQSFSDMPNQSDHRSQGNTDLNIFADLTDLDPKFCDEILNDLDSVSNLDTDMEPQNGNLGDVDFLQG